MRSFLNTTNDEITVTWCTDQGHYGAGQHTDPDQSLTSQAVKAGGTFTFDDAEDNGDDILAQLDAMTEV